MVCDRLSENAGGIGGSLPGSEFLSENLPFDPEVAGKARAERKSESYQGETCRKKFHRADHTDHRQCVNDKRDDRDDETEFGQGHL